MQIGYLFIWLLFFFIFKYDLKQNNIDAIIRTTCFTLLSYVILEHDLKASFKEGLSSSSSASSTGQINIPSATTISENPITIKASKYKKQSKKCDYLQKQKQITTNSLFQMFNKLNNSPSVTNSQLQIVQGNFNDLFAIKDSDTDCVTNT